VNTAAPSWSLNASAAARRARSSSRSRRACASRSASSAASRCSRWAGVSGSSGLLSSGGAARARSWAWAACFSRARRSRAILRCALSAAAISSQATGGVLIKTRVEFRFSL
jgi:hypothetical protein